MIDVQKIKEHIWGPVGSTIIHVVVVILLIKFVTFATKEKEPEIEVMIMEADAVDIEELLEPEELEPPDEIIDTVTPPDVNLDFEAPPDIDSTEDVADMDMAALDVLDVQSPLTMKGLYAGRSAGGRAAALRQYNSKYAQITERAVLKALEWLKYNQDPKGSWGSGGNQAGLTGLGLLTFLAHGETPASEDYGPTVEKAIRYLVSSQKDDGTFLNLRGHAAVYSHGIATYALAEAYGLTKIPNLKPAVGKAIQVIIDGQQDHGGWDYKYAKSGRNDSSVNGWQIQALKAAHASGIKNDRLKPAMSKALMGLNALHDKETGRTYYSMPVKNPHGNHGLTAVSVLCHQLLGKPKDGITKRGLDSLDSADCAWSDNTLAWPYYAWYYIAQAKFHSGSGWKNWNARMVKTLTEHQNEDGSWPSKTPIVNAAGDKQKDAKRPEEGQGLVYSTTLAALSLQVYYRFLPTYKAEAVQEDGPAEEELDDDEVIIEII